MTTSTMRAWLSSMDETQLATVIERNPLVSAGATVRDLDELAARLAHPATMSNALASVPLPVVEAVEAASALGEYATPAALLEVLDDSGFDAEAHRDHVEVWLGVAVAGAMMWIDEGRLRINPGIDQILLMPLAIGRPARVLLGELTSDDLARLLRQWASRTPDVGVSGAIPTRKAERLAAASALFADPEALRRVIGQAPDGVLSSLTVHVNARLNSCRSVVAYAAEGERLDDEDDADDDAAPFSMDDYRARHDLWEWATSAGIAFGRGFGYVLDAEMPSEIYLALARADFRTPFHPETPVLAAPPTSAEQIDRASSAAAAQFLGGAMAILEAVSRGGMKLLKTGGVGARELTRFAKQVGCDVATLRITVTAAARLGLLDIGYRATHLATSDEFEQWRRRPPEVRMLDLVMAWFSPGVAATRDRDEDDAYIPALKHLQAESDIPMGYVLTRTVAEQPGKAVVSGDELVDAVIWYDPLLGEKRESLRCLYSEAHILGILADGAVAPFADALCAGDEHRARELLSALLPDESSEVLFGSDLTVVIAGNPSADVVDVLDVVANREGHGVANTWRITEASIREALDTGYAVDDLLTTLRAIAGGPLPQALDYLLRDVARRHGQLTVRTAAAVVVCEDEAMLAEVVGSRKLRTAGLRLVSPTVALATSEVAGVLRALRAAGYLPVQTDADGEPVVELRRLPTVDAGAGVGDGDGDAGGNGDGDGDAAGAGHAGGDGDAAGDAGGDAAGDARGAARAAAPEAGDDAELDDELDAELAALLASLNDAGDIEDSGRAGAGQAAAGSGHGTAGSGHGTEGTATAGTATAPESAAELARRLLANPDGEPTAPTDTEGRIAQLAPRLGPAEVHELADAIVNGRAVRIRYRSQSGGETVRTISGMEVIGATVYAFCHTRNDDRQFRLDRIVDVAPAGLF